MLFTASYKTITDQAEALFKDRGSKFFAFACPVNSEADFKERLHTIKEKFPDATHHCFACVLGSDAAFQKDNDDGEPANTAGKPILRAIRSKGLTNTAVIVVRYFGGTMLGVPGLINAYGTAAKEALDKCAVIEKQIEEKYLIKVPSEMENEMYRLIKRSGGRVLNLERSGTILLELAIPVSGAEQFASLQREFYQFEVKYSGVL